MTSLCPRNTHHLSVQFFWTRRIVTRTLPRGKTAHCFNSVVIMRPQPFRATVRLLRGRRLRGVVSCEPLKRATLEVRAEHPHPQVWVSGCVSRILLAISAAISGRVSLTVFPAVGHFPKLRVTGVRPFARGPR
jgi:hypothetical protein